MNSGRATIGACPNRGRAPFTLLGGLAGRRSFSAAVACRVWNSATMVLAVLSCVKKNRRQRGGNADAILSAPGGMVHGASIGEGRVRGTLAFRY